MNYQRALHHSKMILKKGSIDMDKFLDNMTLDGLTSVTKEWELKQIGTYTKQIDETFASLQKENPQRVYESVVEILRKMKREDIIKQIQDTLDAEVRRSSPSSHEAMMNASSSQFPNSEEQTNERQSWDGIRDKWLKLRDDYNVELLELLRKLEEKRAVIAIEAKQIRDTGNMKHQYDQLLNVLTSKNPHKYVPIFLQALTEIDRQDARDFLEGGNGFEGSNRIGPTCLKFINPEEDCQ
ncbi:unnamed protein product [Darwinula stevensoni]|uniref:CARD domain-containing protein n=1 Tax=Darwinula stevensoni TaxID=69355 RepID=A0A7R9AFN3_9CRUS|nr:unnamed protein product [Darwinula stevensoni]CAG0902590.1 unnamed protein product [Darwinula stevensoni]